MASTFKVEVEMKSDVQKIWNAMNDFIVYFPKVFPHTYKKVETLQGDGNSAGSVRAITYVEGGPLTTLTEKLELVDDAKKTINYSIIDGDLVKLYKTFKITISLCEKGNGTIVSYFGEYEKLNDNVPNPDPVMGFIVNALNALDAHLLNQ